MVGTGSLHSSFTFFLFEHFNNKTLKKNIGLLSCMGNTVDGGRERSSRKLLNLEKEMQMLMGPGTTWAPPSSPSSRTRCAILQHPSPSPSSRSLSRRPSTTFLTYFCAQHQNPAPCRKSTWVAYTSFPSTSLLSTFCLRSTSSAHVDLVWPSLTLLLFICQSSALLDSAPEYQESYPNPPALPVCLGSWGCMSTHTRIMALRDPV